MLADTLVIDGATCTKIKEGDYASEYYFRNATRMIQLNIRHQRTKATAEKPMKDRHNVELVITTFATPTALENVSKSYVVIEQPLNYPSILVPSSLMALLIGNSNAVLTSICDWNS